MKKENQLLKWTSTMKFISIILAFILLSAFNMNAIDITGVVLDKTGESLPGVSVTVKGTTTGTATDLDGRFSLSVPNKDAVLVFSYVGFVTQQITVGNRTKIDVILAEDTQMLDEIVVVGYGTQKKADLGGNVATLNARDLQSISVANLSNALAGRLPGVDIRQSSGGKPGNSADVVVGVRGTWNSTAPLYVIDGIVRGFEDFNMLNSSEIESFSVLKDASAAAVYGARASNGVFLVTTKKGKSGKPTITYSGAYTVGEPAYQPERETFEMRYRATSTAAMEQRNVYGKGLIITDDGYQPRYTSIYDTNASSGYINSTPFSDEAYAYYKNHQYDRLKEVYQTPVTNDHSVNVSGGNELVTYFIGGNYYDESGIFKSVGYKKYSVRSNLETAITKNLKASLSINLSNNQNKTPLKEDGSAYDSQLADIFYGLSNSSRLIPGMVDGQYIVTNPNANGSEISYTAMANGAAGSFEQVKQVNEYTASLTWDVPWIKGLQIKGTYNDYRKVTGTHTRPLQYEAYLLLRGNNPDTEYFKSGGKDPLNQIIVPELGAHATRGTTKVWQESNEYKSYQLNGIVSYANTFGRHAFEGLFVYEQTEDESIWDGGKKQGLLVSDLPYLIFGGDNRDLWELWGQASEGGRLSYVGRLGYTYDNRYQAAFSFREDLSSKFGPTTKQRKGFFPAANVYWRVSEESFMKNISWLNNLKLRASIGLTGNDNVSAFQYKNTASLNKGGMYWGGTAQPAPGLEFGAIANPSITWEKTLNRNIGIDLGLINMFNISANLWKKHTYDILGSQNGEVPDTFGASFANVNYGQVDSRGFDLQIDFNKQLSKDLRVWARGNFSWAENKLIEYAEAGVPEHLSKLGKNYDRWVMNKSDGIVWTMKPQLDGQGNRITKDYDDGKGPQTMYVVTTSKGNTYIVPENYYLNNTNGWINSGNYNSLRPGVVFNVDLDGDGHYTELDSDKGWGITHFNPPYYYGLSLGGEWKGLSLEVLLQGSAGNQNYVKYDNMASYEYHGSSYAFWTGDMYSSQDNPTGTMPILVNGPSEANNGSDFWVRNASYLRVKNVTLAYDLPKSALASLRVSGLRVYVSAQNLFFVFNNLKFFDPELTSGRKMSGGDNDNNMANNPGYDKTGQNGSGRMYDSGMMNYPLMRTLSCGLTLSF